MYWTELSSPYQFIQEIWFIKILNFTRWVCQSKFNLHPSYCILNLNSNIKCSVCVKFCCNVPFIKLKVTYCFMLNRLVLWKFWTKRVERTRRCFCFLTLLQRQQLLLQLLLHLLLQQLLLQPPQQQLIRQHFWLQQPTAPPTRLLLQQQQRQMKPQQHQVMWQQLQKWRIMLLQGKLRKNLKLAPLICVGSTVPVAGLRVIW